MAKVTLYHGTIIKHVDSILERGLHIENGNYGSAGWYVLATDFASALYHAAPEAGQDAIVVEFELDISQDDKYWPGYPELWPAEERRPDSHWYALMMPIAARAVKKIHHVPYDQFMAQKQKGF